MLHETLPIAVSATVTEERGAAGRYHLGAGCSWSPARAAIGAITEAMQARIADTHATRESILRFEDPGGAFSNNTRRRPGLPSGRWYFDAPAHGITLGDLPDRSGTIDDEVARVLRAIGAFAKQIAVVDLTPGEPSFAVVRAICPELEALLVDGRIGRIARAIVEDR
jgi:ribosomal protein S12 methylthiotransferase accessory factor YcaO